MYMHMYMHMYIYIYISDSGGLRLNGRQFFNLALCDKMLANFSIWHSVTVCSTIFQFSPLWRNARQFVNLVHSDGMLANFLILPSVTGCSPSIRLDRCICICIRICICICIYIYIYVRICICSICTGICICICPIFQFSTLWRNARKFFNLTRCHGMLVNLWI